MEDAQEDYQVEFLDPKTKQVTDANIPAQIEVSEPPQESIPDTHQSMPTQSPINTSGVPGQRANRFQRGDNSDAVMNALDVGKGSNLKRSNSNAGLLNTNTEIATKPKKSDLRAVSRSNERLRK